MNEPHCNSDSSSGAVPVDCLVLSESILIRRTVAEILDAEPDLRVVNACDRKTALRDLDSFRPPRVAVLHGRGPNEKDLAEALTDRFPGIRLVLVDRNIDPAEQEHPAPASGTLHRIQSPFGSGGRAWSSFRLQLLEAVRDGSSDRRPPENVVEERRPGVLVVDDETSIRFLVKSALTGAGYHVDAAGDPDQALRLLEDRTDVRVMLTDMLLPRLSGLELAARVRERRPGVRIILMSGDPTAVPDDAVRRTGIHSFLTKPFDLDTLLENIGEASRAAAADTPTS